MVRILTNYGDLGYIYMPSVFGDGVVQATCHPEESSRRAPLTYLSVSQSDFETKWLQSVSRRAKAESGPKALENAEKPEVG